ncbi:hypothetical protein [Micromonospora coerulea]
MSGDSPFGRGPYSCFSSPAFEPGSSSKGTFYMKITKVIPNATGSIGRWDCSKPPASSHYREVCEETPADQHPDNDEAQVIINPDPAASGTLAGRIIHSPLTLAAGLALILLAVGGWRYLHTRRRTVLS